MTNVARGLGRAAARAIPTLSANAPAISVVAGQPTHATHPELLGPGELGPGLHASEFEERRRALASAMPRDSLAVLPATATAYMTGVIPYPHRQDADFLYLTGIDQPGAVALVHGQTGDLTLFTSTPDANRERWDGARLSAEAAAQVFGAQEVFDMADLPRLLPDMLAHASAVYYDPEKHFKGELARWSSGDLGFREATHQPLRDLTHRLRWRKSAGEAALMARSSAIAEEGLLRAMRSSLTLQAPGERHLAADFDSYCRRSGAARMAYPPVVASGVDACTIHYSRNDKLLQPGNLLLFDGGCELHGYCSDVTRTWPLGGKFSPAQRDVYDIVHGIQQSLIDWCRAGITLRLLHERSVKMLCEGLVDLGLAPSMPVARNLYRTFYPHSLGHWLGMDTHDTPSISHDRLLEHDVHLTIEPGLYIPDDPRYGELAGIGVRIEDVIRINEGPQCTVLSRSMPTDSGSIEEYMVAE